MWRVEVGRRHGVAGFHSIGYGWWLVCRSDRSDRSDPFKGFTLLGYIINQDGPDFPFPSRPFWPSLAFSHVYFSACVPLVYFSLRLVAPHQLVGSRYFSFFAPHHITSHHINKVGPDFCAISTSGVHGTSLPLERVNRVSHFIELAHTSIK